MADRTELRLLHRWIALSSLYEDMLVKIANEVYQVYKKNQIFDEEILDKCRAMDEMFDEGRRHEKEMETHLSGVAAKNKATSFISKQLVRWNLTAYRRSLGDKIQELGLRALQLNQAKVNFTDSKKIKHLCKRAKRYQEDADGLWDEMVVFHEERKKSGKRKPTNALEWLIINGGGFTRKLMENKSLRDMVRKMSGYNKRAEQQVADEYGSVEGGD